MPDSPHNDPPEVFAFKGAIGKKLIALLALVFVLFISINEAVHHFLIKPSFTQLDQAESVNHFTRILAAINQETERLHQTAQLLREVSADPMGRTLHHHDNEDLFTIRVAQGEPSHESQTLTPSQQTYLVEAVRSQLVREQSDCRGTLRLPDGTVVLLAAISAQPGNDLLITGRMFNNRLVEWISKTTGVSFSIHPAKQLLHDDPLPMLDRDSESIAVENSLVGLDGHATSSVSLAPPTHHAADSAAAFAIARRSFVLYSIAALLFLLLLLGRIVIRPLALLRNQIGRISEGATDIEHLHFDSEDEIADLANSFDKMMTRLSTAQEQLADASIASGRSEVAATVIHNVGNVLTNVNSLVDTARDQNGQKKLHLLHCLADQLEQTDPEPALLAETPKYLHRLASQWELDQDELATLLDTLEDNLTHIHDVIRDQQRHTKQGLTLKSVLLLDLICEAVGCCQEKLKADSVDVLMPAAHHDLADAEVMVDRSLMLQVMINVITNSHQSMLCKPTGQRKLRVALTSNQGTIEVAFRDEGVGMDTKTIHRAFDAGFTTRQTGSGLGLHFCAITVKRFGGSIQIHSDGAGQGCTVHLSLPSGQHQVDDTPTRSTHAIPLEFPVSSYGANVSS